LLFAGSFRKLKRASFRKQSRGWQTGVGDFGNGPYAIEAWGRKNDVVRTASGWRLR
jgi:hypothetical protein